MYLDEQREKKNLGKGLHDFQGLEQKWSYWGKPWNQYGYWACKLTHASRVLIWEMELKRGIGMVRNKYTVDRKALALRFGHSNRL